MVLLLAKICFEMEIAVHNMSANTSYGERGLLHRNARYFKQRSRFDIGISFRGLSRGLPCVFTNSSLGLVGEQECLTSGELNCKE